MTINRLGFIAFPVSDLDRARAFYKNTLGLSVSDSDPRWVDFDLGGVRLRTYLHKGEYRRQHSGLQCFVDGVDNAVQKLMDKGVEFRCKVRDEPWGGRVVTMADPDNNLLDLVDSSYAAVLSDGR